MKNVVSFRNESHTRNLYNYDFIKNRGNKSRENFEREMIILDDNRLSWEAKGALCYLLSLPCHYPTQIKFRLIDELKHAGYIDVVWGEIPKIKIKKIKKSYN